MDIVMPVMNGFEATLEIRKYEESQIHKKRCPIVGLSGNAANEDRDTAM
jgi:CheY-like chemotaxis protein